MQSRKIALAVLASAFMSTTALAQTAPPAERVPSPPAKSMTDPSAKDSATPMDTIKPMESAAPAGAVAVNSAPGQWRTSKLIGVDVYNAANEKIGDINELITGADGKIDTVVVGVGGFLGIGEHQVGIKFEEVKFSDQPMKSSTTTGTGSTTTTTSSDPKDYPDHAMVNMTKDQLKELPAFKYASDTSSSTTTRTTTSPAPAARPAAPAPANPPVAR